MSQPRAGRAGFLTPDFALVCASTLLVFGVSHLLLPILPLYVLQVGGHEGDIGWVVASFNVATFLVRPWSGKWSERMGPARVLRVAAGLALVGASMYNFASLVWLLVLSRVFHGFGHGAAMISSSSMVAYMAPASQRGRALGAFLLFANLTLAIGPLVGVGLASAFGFNTVFIAVSAMMLVSFALTQLTDRHNQYKAEEESSGKLINMGAFLPAIVGLTVYFTYGVLASYLVPFAIQRGLDNAAWFFTAYAVCAAATRIVGGTISDRMGRLSVIIPGATAIAIAMFWLGFAPNAWSIVGAGALYGLGTGVLFPSLVALAVDMVGPNERSSAVSTFFMSSDLGQALGALVSSILVTRLPLETVWFVAGTIAFGGLSLFIILERRVRLARKLA